MALVVMKQSGSLKNFEGFLYKNRKRRLYQLLNEYGKQGVELLRDATPVDTGKTATGWDYEIEVSSQGVSLYWVNNNVNEGVPIAILIQYGHATRSGSYVQGVDYINPALRPLFESMATKLWKEVS
jgi:hypothetical protein|nr:MAG TPA: type I neck protein [Caudoviricetes sp.]